MQTYSMSMLELANLLTTANVMGVNHTVRDKTGLKGKYSFALTFTPASWSMATDTPRARAFDL